MKTCIVDGCEGKQKTRQMCNRHYLHWMKYGDPLGGKTHRKRGDGTVSKSNGYRLISIDGKQVLEHVAVAEEAVGKTLPIGAQVHHVNGIKTDNRPSNLVVCPSESYHKLLHRRQQALDESGSPSKRHCRYCDKWDLPENLYMVPGKDSGYHRECRKTNRKD